MKTEPTLQQLQRWMKGRIQPGRAADESAGGAVLSEQAPLNPQGGAPGEERLAVYAEGYVVRIREALAETYEAVLHVLGRETFAELAVGYARRHPSREYDLGLAGRHLPEFLAEHPLTRELPFLPDLARLEWAAMEAFHAFEQPPLSTAELAGLPAEGLERAHFLFQPSVRLASFGWPVVEIWEQRKRPREEVSVELAGRPQRVLIFQQGGQVHCELLEPAQHELLAALLEGRPLGESFEAWVGREEQPPISAWFAGWVQRGLITGLASAERS